MLFFVPVSATMTVAMSRGSDNRTVLPSNPTVRLLLLRPEFYESYGILALFCAMMHPDARTLKQAAQAEKRRIARTMREAGQRFTEIGARVGRALRHRVDVVGSVSGRKAWRHWYCKSAVPPWAPIAG
jgi:hypothetical protein